jgi:hypothetical protein
MDEGGAFTPVGKVGCVGGLTEEEPVGSVSGVPLPEPQAESNNPKDAAAKSTAIFKRRSRAKSFIIITMRMQPSTR